MLKELKPPGQPTVIIIIRLQYFAANRLFGEYPASGVDAKELKPPGQTTVIIIIIGLQWFAANHLVGECLASGVDAKGVETPRSGNNQHHYDDSFAAFYGKWSVW